MEELAQHLSAGNFRRPLGWAAPVAIFSLTLTGLFLASLHYRTPSGTSSTNRREGSSMRRDPAGPSSKETSPVVTTESPAYRSEAEYGELEAINPFLAGMWERGMLDRASE